MVIEKSRSERFNVPSKLSEKPTPRPLPLKLLKELPKTVGFKQQRKILKIIFVLKEAFATFWSLRQHGLQTLALVCRV